MNVVDLVVQIALQVAIAAWIVRRDMRRLRPALYMRSWNDVSFWIAIIVFWPLCIPVHFVRTRRTVWGLVVGLAWMALALVAIFLVTLGLDWVTGSPPS
ncbi:MAG TPA: hypothetical protein VH062_29750 [Polyangiaceae bacterium]|jgi:hypothetical protein|nr:hypothetical protein [Polyangiaceae bacterium]